MAPVGVRAGRPPWMREEVARRGGCGGQRAVRHGGEAAVALYVGTGERTAPDNVVPRIERNLQLYPVLLGIVFDHGGSLPGGAGASVVFRKAEGGRMKLLCPF